MNNIREMIESLKHNPNVVGILEYGGRDASENLATGDYDLMIILHSCNPMVTSLHFDVGDVPVDLNLFPLAALRQLTLDNSFELQVIVEGRVIYDPTGEVQRQKERLLQAVALHQVEPWSEHTIAFIRHGHRHLFDKVQGRLQSMPTLCQVLLYTNIYWLLENYFRLRYLPFRGPKQALAYLQEHDEVLYSLIEAFYRASSLEEKFVLSHQITAMVLEPVGGMWQKGEILAFGKEETRDLQQQGLRVYTELFQLENLS